jgi:hypothetical protein
LGCDQDNILIDHTPIKQAVLSAHRAAGDHRTGNKIDVEPARQYFYIGMRKWMYHVKAPADIDRAIKQLVEGFYANARTIMHAALTRKTEP